MCDAPECPSLTSPSPRPQTLTAKEVSDHATADSAWVIVDGGVYDVTEFLEEHPGASPSPHLPLLVPLAADLDPSRTRAGGKKVLLKACGKDSSKQFWQFHNEKILKKVAAQYRIGSGASPSLALPSSCPPRRVADVRPRTQSARRPSCRATSEEPSSCCIVHPRLCHSRSQLSREREKRCGRARPRCSRRLV